MKANLVIGRSIYIMNCKIKPRCFGTYLHVKSIPELESLLRYDPIVFTNMESKYYTGKVAIYRYSEDTFSIQLEGKDFSKAAGAYLVKTILLDLGLSISITCLIVLLISLCRG